MASAEFAIQRNLGKAEIFHPRDVPRPAQLRLQQYCLNACDLRPFKDCSVGNEVTPVDFEDGAKAALMEALKESQVLISIFKQPLRAACLASTRSWASPLRLLLCGASPWRSSGGLAKPGHLWRRGSQGSPKCGASPARTAEALRAGIKMHSLPQHLLFLEGAALLLVGCCGSSSHSLRYFLTSASAPGQAVPQFYAVGYVDDQPYGFFDVATRRAIPLGSWVEESGKENHQYADRQSQRGQTLEVIFRKILALLRDNQSSSTEFHTLQVTGGCVVGADGRPEDEYIQSVYDGEDFVSFDKESLTWMAAMSQAREITGLQHNERIHSQYWKTFLEEECLDDLRLLLEYGNETLQRTVPPTVKVAHKKHPDGQEALVCRAYGFYPKEIEVTWTKDDVQQQDTLTGGVVPNSDWTYHKWLSIDVEPRDRDHYRCHVEHDGLREPLDLAWEEPASVPHVGLIVGALLAAVLVGGVIYYYSRRCCMRRG